MGRVKYSSRFIYNFEIGDNIVYNTKVLDALYSCYGKSNSKYLYKPIVITTMSIVEAMLYDFFNGVRKGSPSYEKAPDGYQDFINEIKSNEKNVLDLKN